MPSVRKPFALINITTGPCEHTIATHVTHLPLPIIRLCLILFRVDSRLDFSLKKTLSMILTLLPIAAVASKAPFENQHAESFSLTLLEISQVALIENCWILFALCCDKAFSVRGLIKLLPKIDRSILKVVTTHLVILDKLLDTFDSLNICLSLNSLKVKLWRCFGSLHFFD